MGSPKSFLLISSALLLLSTTTTPVRASPGKAIGVDYGIHALNRSSFPPAFIFGTASAAYQYEGAANEYGRGPSIWDTYTHKYPGRIADGSNGDVALDSYHRYKEDVRIMKEMGMDSYRFSISWSRLLPWYVMGNFAPGRCSEWQNLNCTGGDSGTEPYLVAHHLLLSHSAAFHLYRNKYQASQKGKIGITLISHWMVPYSNTKQDLDAASRAIDFILGWFMDPVTFGDYPQSMRSLVGNRLPEFTKDQSMMLKGSYDFVGLNYYTAYYASDNHGYTAPPNQLSYDTDSLANLTALRNGTLIGEQAASSWLFVYPRGIYDLLIYTRKKYNNPIIYITENGIDEANTDNKLSLKEQLNDPQRIDYYHRHLAFLRLAIKDGVDLRGYFAWSLLDNFEWDSGYTVRFGINYVDYKNGLKRYPKLSAKWFKNFLRKSVSV